MSENAKKKEHFASSRVVTYFRFCVILFSKFSTKFHAIFIHRNYSVFLFSGFSSLLYVFNIVHLPSIN